MQMMQINENVKNVNFLVLINIFSSLTDRIIACYGNRTLVISEMFQFHRTRVERIFIIEGGETVISREGN